MIYIFNVLYDYIFVFFKCLKKTLIIYIYKYMVVFEYEIDFERSYVLFVFYLGLCDKILFFKNWDR